MVRLLRSATLAMLCCAAVAATPDARDDDALEVNAWPVAEYRTLPDGKHRALVLFLFHRTTGPDGRLYSANYLAWIEAPDFTALLPLYYRIGPPQRRETMLVPLWFHGRDHDIAPLLLTASWRDVDGGRTTWATPLAHWSTAADGHVTSLHALNYVQGGRGEALLPLAYSFGEAGRRHVGVIPAFFAGPDGWFAPPLLSGGWRDGDERTTWLTPLAHWSTDASGVSSLHVGPYVRTRGTDVVFPIAWWGGGSATVIPFWFGSPSRWISPVALSGHWPEDDGGASTWITPLAHVRADARGQVASWHALNVVHGRGVDTVFPLAWRFGEPGDRTGCVLPLYVQTRDAIVIPPLLAYASRRPDPEGRALGVLPLWMQGHAWWCSPAALSFGSRDADGSRRTWLTPLAHVASSPARRTASEHVGPYVAWRSGGGVDGDGHEVAQASHRLVFPLFWRSSTTLDGRTEAWTAALPLAISGPHALVIPPLLSASWRDADGARTTWATPLAHRATRADGSVSSQHALLYFQDDERGVDARGRPTGLAYRLLFPLWYHQGRTADGITATSDVVLPAWFSGPDYTIVPPLISGRWRNADGGHTTLATPLCHVSTDGQGKIASMHALTYVAGRDWRALLPLAYERETDLGRDIGVIPAWFQGPGYRAAPLALSFWRRDADGASTTWLTPLAHWSRGRDGAITSLHVASYVRVGDTHLALPLGYVAGQPGARDVGVVPAWFSGPGWWIAPPALSGGWTTASGERTTWLTPLFHRTRAADGSLRSLHVGPYLHDERSDILFPIAWRSESSSGIVPLWFAGRDWQVVPPLLSGSWARADGGRTRWLTPLAHLGTDASGRATDWHALDIVHTDDVDALLPLAWNGRDSSAVLPLWYHDRDRLLIAPSFYSVTSGAERWWGLAPLLFATPRAWIAPPALAARWRDGERTTTLATPLYHRTTEHGRLVHEHLLSWVATPTFQAALPLYWRWTDGVGTKRTVLWPVADARTTADGDRKTTLPPLCFSYHRGEALDTSLAYELVPFLVQRARRGYEVNLLWWFLHVRSQDRVTETAMFPLWHSEHHDAAPAKWQVLGGLLGRQTNYAKKTTRLYALWLIPLGKRHHYGEGLAARS